MTEKQKARQQVPGKDKSSEILTHCAACDAPIAEGDRVAYCVIPVGLTFTGRMIGEKLAVCSICVARAKSGMDGEAWVNDAIIARHLGPEVEQGGEEKIYTSPGRWTH